MRLASVRSLFLSCLHAAALTLSACGGGGGADAPVEATPIGPVTKPVEPTALPASSPVAQPADPASSPPAAANYTLGGTLKGLLDGTRLSLVNNNGETLSLSANGSFAFKTSLATAASYAVSIGEQAAGQVCTVAKGSGTVATANVDSIEVSCATTYQIGGSVSGLGTGTRLSLMNGAGETLALSANGAFAFKTRLVTAASFAVTIGEQPTDQVCTLTRGSGTVAAANVTDIAVTCAPIPRYVLGGTVSGLLGGARFTLVSGGSDSLDISTTGAFQFATKLTRGTSYSVSASTQPAGQTCSVSNGSGSIATADIANIAVVCTPIPTYSIGGNVTGLTSGLSLGLSLSVPGNTTQVRSLSASGAFAFPTPMLNGTAYAASITTQPVGQTCVLTNGSGTVAQANVTSIGIACTTNPPATYFIRGTVSGLVAGASVSLRNNGGTAQTVNTNGSFDFQAQETATPYAITVATQPSAQTSAKDQTCTVSNGSGTVAGADVTTIAVNCVTNTYAVGGTVSGLTSGTVTLLNNGTALPPISANGSFSLPLPLRPTGTAYAISVGTQPAGLICAVSRGTGTVNLAAVSNIAVICSANPQFALVANYSNNTVTSFLIDSTSGALTAVGTPVTSGGLQPRGISVTPNSRFAYVVNEASATVAAFKIETNGDLTPVGTVAAPSPANVTVDPTGKFVYVPNRTGNAVNVYGINSATGALTLNSTLGSPNVGNQPRDITFHPAGAYAFVSHWADNTIRAYAVNAGNGALTPTGAAPVATGANPYRLIVDPSGQYLYTVNCASEADTGSVSVYDVNASTGALTAKGAPVAAGSCPFSLTTDSATRTLYVGNYSQVFYPLPGQTPPKSPIYDNTLSVYSLTAGSLSAGTKIAVSGSFPNDIKIDATGKFAYVANSGSGAIARFAVNPTTGALTLLGTTPSDTGASPTPYGIAVVRP